MAADDEPDFLMLTNKSILEREKLPYGAGTKQPSRKLTSGVSDRLMVQALQKQVSWYAGVNGSVCFNIFCVHARSNIWRKIETR